MAIPNPNPNIADGIKCDNKTYSSNKIESLIKTATELPIPEAGDAGKVLTVNSDSDGYELDVVPSELPTPEAGDAGKVLTVNAAEDGYELDTPAIDASVYKIGDTITATAAKYLAGRLNNAGDKVLVFYPVSKPIDPTVTGVSITISGANLCYTTAGNTAINNGTYTGTITDGGFTIILDLATSVTGGAIANATIVDRSISFS